MCTSGARMRVCVYVCVFVRVRVCACAAAAGLARRLGHSPAGARGEAVLSADTEHRRQSRGHHYSLPASTREYLPSMPYCEYSSTLRRPPLLAAGLDT